MPQPLRRWGPSSVPLPPQPQRSCSVTAESDVLRSHSSGVRLQAGLAFPPSRRERLVRGAVTEVSGASHSTQPQVWLGARGQVPNKKEHIPGRQGALLAPRAPGAAHLDQSRRGRPPVPVLPFQRLKCLPPSHSWWTKPVQRSHFKPP